jgi:mono/diheme cytochrome c family protein
LSSASARRIPRLLAGLVLSLLAGSVGCWEQWSNEWFPQMKWQPAVQAFEAVNHGGRVEGFLPPEGSVPIDGGEAPVSLVDDAEADRLTNPRPTSLESLENGRARFATYCAPCHGPAGMGDGTVSMTGPLRGPFAAVLPINGPASLAKMRSDGHIYTTIRYGRRRMPGYARMPSEDRWDIVNYLRYLNGQKGVQP